MIKYVKFATLVWLIAVVWLSGCSAPTAKRKSAPPSVETVMTGTGTVESERAKFGTLSVPSEGARDPFDQGPVAITPVAPDNQLTSEPDNGLILEGLLEDNGKYSAFINGELRSQGDVIAGWRIISIAKENVVLAKAGLKKVLKIEK